MTARGHIGDLAALKSPCPMRCYPLSSSDCRGVLDVQGACRMSADPGHLWVAAPKALSLTYDQIHVWRAHLGPMRADVQALERVLTPDEVDRAERYRFPEDRERYIITRNVLRAILGRYLHQAPADIRFRYGPNGKPAVNARTGENGIHFNLSHSHNLALYAIACNRQVGIDVEYIRPIPEVRDIVERFFSEQEKAEFGAFAPDEQLGAFFGWWTRKEAYAKARGPGLALALDRIEVSLAPDEAAELPNVVGHGGGGTRWSLCDLAPSNDYAAALAVEGQGWDLSCWQWTG